MAACIQAGSIFDNQALALANLQILAILHIAVHGAVFAVKDDAAGVLLPVVFRTESQ